MGKGVFADQDIKAGDYIVPYDVKVTHRKPKVRNNYIAQIKIQKT